METVILIKRLNEIDRLLEKRTYKEEKKVTGRLSGEEIILPAVTRHRYDPDMIKHLLDSKSEIINTLYENGYISEDNMESYWLSEDMEFSPEIKSSPLILES